MNNMQTYVDNFKINVSDYPARRVIKDRKKIHCK